MYKAEYPFLKEVDSLALANVQLNLQSALKIVLTNLAKDKMVFQNSSLQSIVESPIQLTTKRYSRYYR